MVISCMWLRLRGDPPELEQVETERLDLREDTEQRGAVFERTGEHRLAGLQLGGHRRARREGGESEPAPYAERIQPQRCCHAIMLPLDVVSRRDWDPVIACRPLRATAAAFVSPRSR